jgi:hypothetical protein
MKSLGLASTIALLVSGLIALDLSGVHRVNADDLQAATQAREVSVAETAPTSVMRVAPPAYVLVSTAGTSTANNSADVIATPRAVHRCAADNEGNVDFNRYCFGPAPTRLLD